MKIRGLLLIGAVLLLTTMPAATAAEAQDEPAEEEEEKEGFWARFKDPEDGKFDITAGGTGESAKGFLPLLIPFNEPALGFGVAAAVAYFHPRKPPPEGVEVDKSAPPTTSLAGGAYTQNGTWAAAIGHNHSFKGGKYRYLGILGYGDANLDYYGTGVDDELNEDPVLFKIVGFVTAHKFTYRVGKSRFFVGGSYSIAAVDVDLETDLDVDDGAAKDGGISAFFSYDTRDTHFTPNRGSVVKASLGYHADGLGGDFNYGRFSALGIKYLPLVNERLVLGLRLSYGQAGEEAPFWALPFVVVRGIPIFRYLGNYVLTTEVEPRWKIDTRWSVLAFFGGGRAATELNELGDAEKAYGYGVGFRYLMSRKLGLGAGIDLARGPEETTYYIIIGNSWTF